MLAPKSQQKLSLYLPFPHLQAAKALANPSAQGLEFFLNLESGASETKAEGGDSSRSNVKHWRQRSLPPKSCLVSCSWNIWGCFDVCPFSSPGPHLQYSENLLTKSLIFLFVFFFTFFIVVQVQLSPFSLHQSPQPQPSPLVKSLYWYLNGPRPNHVYLP